MLTCHNPDLLRRLAKQEQEQASETATTTTTTTTTRTSAVAVAPAAGGGGGGGGGSPKGTCRQHVCVVVGDVTPTFKHVGAPEHNRVERDISAADFIADQAVPVADEQHATWGRKVIAALRRSRATALAANGAVLPSLATACNEAGIVVLDRLSHDQTAALLAVTGGHAVTYATDVQPQHLGAAIDIKALDLWHAANSYAHHLIIATKSKPAGSTNESARIAACTAPAVAVVLTAVAPQLLKIAEHRFWKGLRQATRCLSGLRDVQDHVVSGGGGGRGQTAGAGNRGALNPNPTTAVLLPGGGVIEDICRQHLLRAPLATCPARRGGASSLTALDCWRADVRCAVARGFALLREHARFNVGGGLALGRRPGDEAIPRPNPARTTVVGNDDDGSDGKCFSFLHRAVKMLPGTRFGRESSGVKGNISRPESHQGGGYAHVNVDDGGVAVEYAGVAMVEHLGTKVETWRAAASTAILVLQSAAEHVW